METLKVWPFQRIPVVGSPSIITSGFIAAIEANATFLGCPTLIAVSSGPASRFFGPKATSSSAEVLKIVVVRILGEISYSLGKLCNASVSCVVHDD